MLGGWSEVLGLLVSALVYNQHNLLSHFSGMFIHHEKQQEESMFESFHLVIKKKFKYKNINALLFKLIKQYPQFM